ncbi:MAG: hypothetical protein DRP79_07110, partial [Planctomycetota bacterium]
PFDADSDDDGLADGEEKLFGTNPISNTNPGIYVRYENSFYTKEYFRVADPDYLPITQGGDKYLITEALVVRRGATFHIGGPVEAALSINSNGLTNLTSEKDLYGGGWTVSVPTDSKAGVYTATVSLDGWSDEMPIYVIFELPTSQLTQTQIEAFLYNDDPDDQRDETSVWWHTNEWSYNYTCAEHDPPCSPDKYHYTRGYSQAFWTHQYEKNIFLNHVMPKIEGYDNQIVAAASLVGWANHESKVEYDGIHNNTHTVLYKYWDDNACGTGQGGYLQYGGACQDQANLLTTFLRSAGIAARPFSVDWLNRTATGSGQHGEGAVSGWYDTSVLVWFGGPEWRVSRSYGSPGEESGCYPWDQDSTTNNHTLSRWYPDRYGDMIVTANEGWDWPMIQTDFPISSTRDFTNDKYEYYWDSREPLALIDKSPHVSTLNVPVWQGDSWEPSDFPSAYVLPNPYPGGNTNENWPIEPVAWGCNPEHTGDCPYPNFIGDRVWNDSDGDGNQDGGESGLSGAVISMTLLSPYTVYTDTSDSNGDYGFIGLPAGTYILNVDSSTFPSGTVLTTDNVPLTVTISAQDSYTTADFGYQVSVGMAAVSVTPDPGEVSAPPTPEAQLTSQSSPHHIFLPLIVNTASAVRLEAIVDDYGLDVNDNGYFDELIVKVQVTASRPGLYTLGGFLALPGGAAAYGGIFADKTRIRLHTGTQTVSLSFAGLPINRAGAQEPYRLEHVWITDLAEFDSRLGPWDKALDSWNPGYVMAHYAAHQFERMAASLTDTYSHRGVDNDGDGRYEAVAIDAALDIFQSGRYRATGDLYDSEGSFVGHATWTGSGSSAELVFELERARPPYKLAHVWLFDAHGALLDSRDQEVYTITDLSPMVDRGPVAINLVPDPSDMRLRGEHITPTQVFNDRTTDLDGDGLYDQLIIDVQVQVDQADEYRVEGWLQAPDGDLVVYGVSEPISLSVGSQMTLSLPFDGRAINGHGVVSGTYTVVALKILDEDENSYTVLDKVHVTGLELGYDAGDFEPASRATTIFSDDMESGTGNWSAQSPWSDNSAVWPWPTENWKAETSTALSGTLSLTPTLSFDLSNYAQPVIRFNTTYSIPSGGNFGYLEASSNSVDWTPMAVYTDTDHWATKLVDLSDFGETPDLQFRFNADSQTGLLWYIDDVYLDAWPAVISASFAYSPTTVLRDETVTFTSTYTSITDTLPITYTWDFDDGLPIEVTTAPTVTHQFTSLLSYTIKLTVENPYDSAVVSDTITATNAAPTDISL